MTKMALLVVLLTTVATPAQRPGGNATTAQPQRELTQQERAIKVGIASIDARLRAPKNRYKVGEIIPVTISLTNTSSQPISVCVSSDLYQDRPKLTKDGKVMPIMQFQSDDVRSARLNQTCPQLDMPEPMRLKPNVPTMVDFMVLVDNANAPTGAMAWYEPLTPGIFELSITRRFDCCVGPTVESNTIRFEVVQ
jgi:hypothetical protein